MSSFKEVYTEEIEALFGGIQKSPFAPGGSQDSVPQEDGGRITPTGWVMNSDGAGKATVVIDSSGIAVTNGRITTDGSIKNKDGIGATVVIDSNGVTITGGALTVTNPLGTVIIDGTSNIFKIVATGTVSIAVAAGVSPNGNSAISDTILSGLGAFATIPICFAGVSFSNALDGNVRQVNREFQFLEGGVAQSRYKGVIEKEVSVGSFRQASTQYAGIRIGCSNYGGTTVTGYARYHLCKEAAL